jgi:hypothetical protein
MFLGGGGGSAPKSIVQQEPVKEEDPAVQKAASDAVRRRRLGRGYRSTILGGAMTADNAPGALQETFGKGAVKV